MAADINDKFTEATNGSRPVATTLTAILPSGSSPGTATCGALTGWPTATAVHFIIYTVDVNGRKVSGSQTDWKGIVSGSTITGLVLKAGTNNGYSIGAVVEAAPTAAWADDVTEGIAVEHNQDGTHKNTLVGMLAGNQTFTGVKTFDAIKFNAPQGFLINGKIETSVASSDLTVAIKTLAGSDPSASSPVYCRIGNTVRSITSALSVTKNDATNWFGSGAAGLATQEIDYFVYLGYNATDGVVVGFARIPWARVYGDFSTTSTNDTYCAISTITTAASTDEYEVVGRFNAILSAGAGYTWSLPATSIIINRPIHETRLLQYTPQVTASVTPPTLGSGGNFEQVGLYRIHQKLVDIPSLSIVFGSGGGPAAGSGNYFIQLPISANVTLPVIGTNAMGEGRMVDQSTGFSGFVFPEIETATTVQPVYYTSFTGAAAGAMNAGAPWTWAASDSIYRGWMRYHM